MTSDATMKRLKHICFINPRKSEVKLADEAEVTFVPMERATEDGVIRTTEPRSLGEVCQGFTCFRDEDVLVAKITPCFENGKGGHCLGLANQTGFGSTEFHVLRPKPGLVPRFLFYITRTHEFRKLGEVRMYGAAGQQRVPESFIQDWLVWLPETILQNGIADYLDRKTAETDALIGKKRRMIDLLHEKRRALISEAVTKGLDPDVPTKYSGFPWLGNVPAHWTVERLRWRLRSIGQGWSPQCEGRRADPGEWGVLKVGCMNSGIFDESENKALPPELDPVPELEIRVGDVLMSRSNTVELVGSVGMVHQTQGRIILCDKLYRLDFDGAKLLRSYSVHLLRSRAARLQIERDATGASSSMKNISNEVVANMAFAFPQLDEQRRIDSFIEVELRKIAGLERRISMQIDRLREYRQTLISNAVTGSIGPGGGAAC